MLVAERGRIVTITPDTRHTVRSTTAVPAFTVYGEGRLRIFFGARGSLFADLAGYIESGAV